MDERSDIADEDGCLRSVSLSPSSDQSASSPLPLRDAVELGHALVQHVAESVGTRVLFIKGPVADAHGVRPPRTSADVDVLVPTTDAHKLISALRRRGWEQRPESFAHRAFVRHSLTLLNPSWPCDIDLHISYPGFLADDRTVFETLWGRRVQLELAQKAIDAPDFVGSVVIAALHSLRSPFLQRNRIEFNDALAAVKSRDDREEAVRQIVSLATATGARHTLGPFLAALGYSETVPAPQTREYLEWQRNARQLNRSAQWIRAILDAPISDAPRIIAAAILPSRTDFLTDHPETPRTTWGLFFARLARLVEGIKALPTALVSIWEERATIRRLNIVDVVPPPRSHTVQSLATEAPSIVPRPPQEEQQVVEDVEVPPSKRVYRRAPHIGEITRDDGVVLLDLTASRSSPLIFSGSACAIWSALDRPRQLVDITRVLATQYGVEPTEIGDDVASFLAELLGLGVVQVGPPRASISGEEATSLDRLQRRG